MREKDLTSKKKQAFSLIELSIVILIVGIIIAGTIQASTMISKAKLRSARSLTMSSPVSSIKDLMVWFETSLESSISSSQRQDGAAVTTWYNNNKQILGNHASGSNPIFYETAFNGGIPGIRFDGDDYLAFDGRFFSGSDYTVFVVEQKRDDSSNNYFITVQATGSSNSFFHFGYALNNRIGLRQSSNDMDYISSVFEYDHPNQIRIHTGMLKQSVGHKYWLNGGLTAEQTNTNKTPLNTVTSSSSGKIGHYAGSQYYTGDVAEVIIFSRALKNEERQAIESYLSQKYDVNIS